MAYRKGRRLRRLVDVSAGIEAARHSIVAPHWGMLGAVGYVGFDIAVLGALLGGLIGYGFLRRWASHEPTQRNAG